MNLFSAIWNGEISVPIVGVAPFLRWEVPVGQMNITLVLQEGASGKPLMLAIPGFL